VITTGNATEYNPAEQYTIVNPATYDWDSIMTHDPECTHVTGVHFGSERLSPIDIAGVAAVYPPVPAFQSLLGDVNGDGKTDLVWNRASSLGNWIYAGLSQGNGSFTITPVQTVGTTGRQNYRTLVGDVNGDGKPDLIWNEMTTSSNRTYVGLSRGDGSFTLKPRQDAGVDD
jgi:hypothetical protein